METATVAAVFVGIAFFCIVSTVIYLTLRAVAMFVWDLLNIFTRAR